MASICCQVFEQELHLAVLDVIGALEQSNGAGSALASALKSSGIASSFASSQAATVFVPPQATIADMSPDDLRNHIVRQSVLDRFRVVLNRPKTLTTDAGRNISIRFEYDYASLFDWEDENRLRLQVGCARAERIATSCNGVIVFLDKVRRCWNFLKRTPINRNRSISATLGLQQDCIRLAEKSTRGLRIRLPDRYGWFG